MSICIVSATSLELQHLSKQQHNVLITGVGAPATIYYLMKQFQNQPPNIVIQAGIAGSFDKNLPLGQALVINADRFADLGVQENDQWSDVFDMNLSDAETHPYSNGWLINPNHDLLAATGLPIVKSISINEITTSSARIQQLKLKYNPAIESMEGAAFHYVCLQAGIPFIQLRTVSNYVGERDKEKWNMKLALENLATQLEALIQKLQ